jgi:hypothetical protein
MATFLRTTPCSKTIVSPCGGSSAPEGLNQPTYAPFTEHDPNGSFGFLNKKKKKAKKPDDASISDNTAQPKGKTEPNAEALFGLPIEQLIPQVGSAHSSKEAEADKLAHDATAQPTPSEASKKPNSTQKGSSPEPVTDAGAEYFPGLPRYGGAGLPEHKKRQFERKVSNLENIQVHKAPEHAKAIGAEAFTVGNHIYMGKKATDATLSHELGHFNPADKRTKKIRPKAVNDSWSEKQAQIQRDKAAEKERQRKLVEAENKRLAKLEQDRKIAAAKKAADAAALKKDQDGKSHRAAGIAQMKYNVLVAQHQKQFLKDNPHLKLIPPRKPVDLSAMKERVRLHKEQKQAKLQATLQHYPGIQAMLKPPLWGNGAISLSEKAMRSDVGVKAFHGAQHFMEPQQQSGGLVGQALKFGQSMFQNIPKVGQVVADGASQVGQTVFNTGQHALTTVEGLPKQAARRLLQGTQILGHKAVKAADHVGQTALHQGVPLWQGSLNQGHKAVKAADHLGTAALHRGESVLQGVFNQGKKLFKGAVDYSNDRQIQTAIAAGLIQSSGASKGAQIRLEVERTAIATSKALRLYV